MNLVHGGRRTSEYSTWSAMRGRCLCPTNRQYPEYGGRGIGVAPEWEDFSRFREDMGSRPKGTTLDRVDNDLGYSKNNCRWATPKTQANNRRMPKPKPVKHSTKTRGISWIKASSKFQVYLLKPREHVGYADTLTEAQEKLRLAQAKRPNQ